MYFTKYKCTLLTILSEMLKVKGWKKMCPANTSQKKAEVTILIKE